MRFVDGDAAGWDRRRAAHRAIRCDSHPKVQSAGVVPRTWRRSRGIHVSCRSVETVIMGRRTYGLIMTS